MNDGHLFQAALNEYHGGDQLYFNKLNPRVKYSEGFKFFLDNAGGGAYWLLTILITQPEILQAAQEHGIVFVRFRVTGSSATLIVERDSGEPPLYRREIPYTDCPDKGGADWLFYFEEMTLILPGEH